jgi:hypothetical protein
MDTVIIAGITVVAIALHAIMDRAIFQVHELIMALHTYRLTGA